MAQAQGTGDIPPILLPAFLRYLIKAWGNNVQTRLLVLVNSSTIAY